MKNILDVICGIKTRKGGGVCTWADVDNLVGVVFK